MRLIDADALKQVADIWYPAEGGWPLSDLHALIDGQPTITPPGDDTQRDEDGR